MIKKTITYTDYNGTERTEDFYFNLSEPELIELEYEHWGYAEQLQKIIDANDTPTVLHVIKDIILRSYGVKSEDGKHFKKSPEISASFEDSPAYPQLYLELMQDPQNMANFVTGVIPKHLSDEAQRFIAEHPDNPEVVQFKELSGSSDNTKTE